jgi:predicted phosphodiesterase
MRTLIVSDLHLGGDSGVDLLSRPDIRQALLAELRDVDRLVLLGDVLELRHGPRRDAVTAARPFFEDLGRVFAGREVVVLAGNHDHALVEPWLARRAQDVKPEPLGPEQRFSAEEASPALAALAAFAAPARVTAAHPGLWLRPDVYATHGHYLDCHLTVPTMERLGLGAMARVLRRPQNQLRTVDDYEAVGAPLFAWIDAVAQLAPTNAAVNGQVTVRAWRSLRPGGRRTLFSRLVAGAFPLGVAALNRAGLGPLRADISRGELRRAGLRAMGEVATRLDLGAGHVIFGHTHRAGPLPGDWIGEWSAPSGARLINAGCWSYDSWFLRDSPAESPYWPGVAIAVPDEGQPVMRRLLDDRAKADLAPPPPQITVR